MYKGFKTQPGSELILNTRISTFMKHVPNLITLLNLALGCTAIILAFSGDMFWVPHLVIAAALADFIDGLAARMLKVSSPLGVQLDSLADMVTFGVLPGVVVYQLLYEAIGYTVLWWQPLPAMLITIFSAIRLAKFNIDTRQSDGFIGVPTPTCTMFIISLLLITQNDRFELAQYIFQPIFLYAVTLIFSLLLIAELPMPALKFKHLGWKGNEIKYIAVALGLALVALLGGLGITIAILIYIFIAIVQKLLGFRRKVSVE